MNYKTSSLLSNSQSVLEVSLAVFSETLLTSSHYIRVKPSFFDYGRAIALVPDWEQFFSSQQDLVPAEDQIDEEDIGIVKNFELHLGDSSIRLVSKLIREHRVPSVFHEPLIIHILSQKGINVPIVVAVLEPRLEGVRSYLVMKEIPNSCSLYQLYRKPDWLNKLYLRAKKRNIAVHQLKSCLENITWDFGAEVHRLFLSGVIHEELDLKNVCLSVTDNIRFFFLDFERTRVVLNEPSSEMLVSAYKESIPRRLARYNLSEHYLQTFADGYISIRPEINLQNLIVCILKIRDRIKTPYMIIGIDGFAGAGKTRLAKYIASNFSDVIILETDAFMRYSRVERRSTSERFNNHRGWYDTKSLGNLLVEIQKTSYGFEKTIYDLYDHKIGEKNKVLKLELKLGTLILVEGMYALDPEIQRNCVLSILLTASYQDLFERVQARDTQKRKISQNLIRKRFNVINGPLYRQFLESNRQNADIIIDTSGKENSFSLEHIHYPLLPFFLNIDTGDTTIFHTSENESKSI